MQQPVETAPLCFVPAPQRGTGAPREAAGLLRFTGVRERPQPAQQNVAELGRGRTRLIAGPDGHAACAGLPISTCQTCGPDSR